MDRLRIYLSTILLITCPVNYAGWSAALEYHEMTGEKLSYARSQPTNTTRKLRKPYNNLSAVLTVGCRAVGTKVFLLLDSPVRFENTSSSGDVQLVPIRIKWDDTINTEYVYYKNGSEHLEFVETRAIINRIDTAKTALIEIKLPETGDAFFRVSLAGSAKALAKMRNKCPPTN